MSDTNLLDWANGITKQAAAGELFSDSPLLDTVRGATSGATVGVSIPLAQQVFRFLGGATPWSSKELLHAIARKGAIGAGIGAGALGLSSLIANTINPPVEQN